MEAVSGYFCYLDEKMCRNDNVFVVVFYLELIRLQVVSAFESPVVTVISWVAEEWPVELTKLN